jgi:hypothetical protein
LNTIYSPNRYSPITPSILVAICGHFGFAQFVDPHLLETILAWQNPNKGCYTRGKPEPVPLHNVVEQPFDENSKPIHKDGSTREGKSITDY